MSRRSDMMQEVWAAAYAQCMATLIDDKSAYRAAIRAAIGGGVDVVDAGDEWERAIVVTSIATADSIVAMTRRHFNEVPS